MYELTQYAEKNGKKIILGRTYHLFYITAWWKAFWGECGAIRYEVRKV